MWVALLALVLTEGSYDEALPGRGPLPGRGCTFAAIHPEGWADHGFGGFNHTRGFPGEGPSVGTEAAAGCIKFLFDKEGVDVQSQAKLFNAWGFERQAVFGDVQRYG